MKHDIFISYRRDGGAATARILRDRLSELGYCVFFDVESLQSGYFDSALYTKIDQCKDFVVILSPNALDSCWNEEDWVRKEVTYALQQNKNIIPVMLPNFRFPDMLPDCMESLRFCNGITASEDFFDAFIDKLCYFLRAKPSFFRSLRHNRLLKRLFPALLAAVLVLGGFLGVKAFISSTQDIYPKTKVEKNLAHETVYYVSQNLTHFDVLADSYLQALDSARRYLSSGMTDGSDMKSQFAATREYLKNYDLSGAAPSELFLTRIADSPFDSAEIRAVYDSLVLFRDDYIISLDYLAQVVEPDYYPSDAAKKLEILDLYHQMFLEDLKIVAYSANQILLPITNEEALGEFWHETLPYLVNIPLRAVSWSRDYDALQSAINESFAAIEKAITDCALIVGDSAVAVEEMEKDILQSLIDQGYTKETAQRIWAYQTEDPEQRKQQRIKYFLSQGVTQTKAEELVGHEEKMLEIQAKMRISFAARTGDDIDTLWDKMTKLLSVDLYDEALECAKFYQQNMTNSNQYLPAVQLFIHLMKEVDLDYGIMVMEYYTPDGTNPLLQIGDIIYGFNGNICENTDDYIAKKAALTTDSYEVDVLRIDASTGQWESLKLTLTTDMPRVYLNNLIDRS